MVARTTKAILHIGIEKTGTTSIQADLAKNKSYLADNGIQYPSKLQSQNHFQIAIPGIAPNSGNKLLEWARVQESSYETYIRQLRSLLQGRVRPGSTWIFSSEFLTSQVSGLREISRIRRFLLSCGFEEFKLIAFLRKPHYLAHSRYVTSLRAGSVAPPQKLLKSLRMEHFDFSRSVELWRIVFGRDTLIAMAYPEHAASHVLYQKFYSAIGIAPPHETIVNSELRENTGLPPTVAEALRELNGVARTFLPQHERTAFRKEASGLLRGLASRFAGEAWLDQAMAIKYTQDLSEHLSQVAKLMPEEEAVDYLTNHFDELPEQASTIDPDVVTAVVESVLIQLTGRFPSCPTRLPNATSLRPI